MKNIVDVENKLKKLLQESENNPDDPELLNDIGVGYLIIGEYGKAESFLRRAINLSENITYLYNLANVYSENNKPEQSIDLYLRVLDRRPDHIPSLNNLADCYEQTGDHSKAAELFSYLTKINDEDPLSHFNFGNFLLRQNRHIEAVGKYEDALKRDENFTEAYYNISWVLLKAGAVKKALEYAEKGLDTDPGYDELVALKAEILGKLSTD